MILLPNLVEIIKKSAVEAVEASNPVIIVFGKITSSSPLKVNIEQKLTLGPEQLLLTDAIKNNINTGDNVILIRQQGGQKYIVLDKVVS